MNLAYADALRILTELARTAGLNPGVNREGHLVLYNYRMRDNGLPYEVKWPCWDEQEKEYVSDSVWSERYDARLKAATEAKERAEFERLKTKFGHGQ